MSTIFDAPCPICGRSLTDVGDGGLECTDCGTSYHQRMGHLFEAGDRRATQEPPALATNIGDPAFGDSGIRRAPAATS